MNEESTMIPDSTNPTPSPEPIPQKKESFFGEIFKFIFFALLIVLPVRMFIAQPFIVSGASMDPSFDTGQYLIVNQLSYHFSNPIRGEVVIFKYPKDPSKYFIKRVIGLPGETIIINGTNVVVKNKQHPLGTVLDEPYIASNNLSEGNLTRELGPTEYFVMGDNRRQSSDSRAWGPVPRDQIIGTPFLRLYPLDKLGILPGDYHETN